MRRLRALVPLLVLAACEGGIHRLLEAPPPPYIRLSVTLDAPGVTVPRGAELAFTATVTRTGEDRGPVTVTVDNAPGGVTASTKSTSTSGDVTTTVVLLRVAADAPIGNYSLTVRARASQANDATSLLVLTVIDPPDFAIATSKPGLTIARGGIARVGVSLSRTNLSSPVAFSATSDPGIGVRFGANPLPGDSTTATIAIDPAVATGRHTLTVRANVEGLPERVATLTLDVTADPLQVIVQGDVAAPQLSRVSQELIVNSGGSSGNVTLSIEGLPSNVSASADALAAGSPTTTLHFDIAGTSSPGSYPLTVRARSAGVPDATATLNLTILPATIALTINPAAATAFAGSGATTALAIARSNFTGAVTLGADGLPPGLSVSFDSSTITGGRATATVSTAPTTAPGAYSISLHATPVGLSPTATQTASMAITVLPAPSSAANVALDWSGCSSPDWVAVQDGAGAWARVAGTLGVFTTSVSSSIGAIAYVERGSVVTVRYMTHAELTAGPLAMCAPQPGPRTVRGTAVHGSASELGAYSLGGGSGTSSATQPNFTITGIRDGVHDLIAHSYFQSGSPSRFLIRRDIAVGPTTDTIATVNFQDAEAFAPVVFTPGITLSGAYIAGETFSHTMSYLTTSACNGGPLYTSTGVAYTSSGQMNFGLTTLGVPATVQRPDDYYLVTALMNGNNSFRSSSIAFHAAGSHPLQIAPVLPALTVSAVSGAYKRLQAAFGSLPAAYNRTIALQYSDGTRSMTVSASRSYLDAGSGMLEMPDLSAVDGWPTSVGISSSTSGAWRFTADGASSDGSACTENRVTYSSGRSGLY